MSEDTPGYGLKEKFSISELERRVIGRIVSVRGLGVDFSLMGKLKHYIQGDIAVLQPYIHYPAPNKDGFQVVDEESIINSPTVVSVFDHKTMKDFIEKYIKPNIKKLEQQKQEKKKGE